MLKHSAQEEAKFKFFKEAVAELSAKVDEEQVGRENDEESLTKEMKHFESQVSQELVKTRGERKEKEMELIR